MKRKRAVKCWKLDFHPDEKPTTRNRSGLRNDKEPTSNRIESLRLLKESAVTRSPQVLRNPELESREMDHSMEESLLAFLDPEGGHDPDHSEEDKLMFLNETYAWCVVLADASVPTEKMYQAMCRNIQGSRSLELTMASFGLLKALDKRHPQVAITEKVDEGRRRTSLKLDEDIKVWLPLEQTVEEMGDPNFMLSVSSTEGEVPLNLVLLVERVAKDVAGQGKRLAKRRRSADLATSHDCVKNVNIMGLFLMLEHLVSLAWKDFSCRLQVTEARMKPRSVQQSYFYRLFHVLSSRDRSSFLSNLVSILNPFSIQDESPNFKIDDVEDGEIQMQIVAEDGVASNKFELQRSPLDFSILAHRLLFMVMEVARINKTWPSDGHRSWSFDFKDLAGSFSVLGDLEAYLQALADPRRKLMFIVEYCASYSFQMQEDLVGKDFDDRFDSTIMERLLNCFGEEKFVDFVHKFKEDFLQLLLSHAFEAFLKLHVEAARQDHENRKLFHRMKLVEVCKLLHKVLIDIQEYEIQHEMLPVTKTALLMAESILISYSSQDLF